MTSDLDDVLRSVEDITNSNWDRRMGTAKACMAADKFGLPGVFVECGVFKGAHPIIAAKVSPQRKIWLYDTFDGMTKPGPEDVSDSGYSAIAMWGEKIAKGIPFTRCPIEQVFENMAKRGVDPNEVKFVVGDVKETLLLRRNVPEEIAVLRIDVDWYDSTKACIEHLYPKVVPNGLVIFDDYGHWRGAKKAVKELLPDLPLHKIDYTAVYGVKPC